MKELTKASLLVLALITMLSLASCGKSEKSANINPSNGKRIVKIAYLPLTHALPLFIEKESSLGGFPNFELELVKFGSWPELLDALNTGKVDGASVLVELAIKAKEQGIDLKAVALGHRDGNVVIVSKDINSARDLKGKTFAIPHRLSSHNILLHIMLKKSGLSISDVKVIELPPPEMPAALSEGRISGYAVAEPFGAKSVILGKGKVLYKSEDLWIDSVCCALVLRNEFITKERTAAREFVNFYAKAGLKADSKDYDVFKISSKYMKVDKNVLTQSLKWISYSDLNIKSGDYESLSSYLTEMKLIKNPPAYQDFVDNTLMGDAAK